MSRACGIGLITFHRTTPFLSMMKVPRVAAPSLSSNTPYDFATAPCGQKSDNISKPKCCWSAQVRSEKPVSTETASSSTSSRDTSGNSSRMAHISPEHTPLKANGYKTMTTFLLPRKLDSRTGVPCWSLSSKSGACSPTSTATGPPDLPGLTCQGPRRQRRAFGATSLVPDQLRPALIVEVCESPAVGAASPISLGST